MTESSSPSRRRPEALTLTTGVLAIVLAVFAFIGDLPPIDPRWVLAAAAAAVGLGLLVSSVRRGRTE